MIILLRLLFLVLSFLSQAYTVLGGSFLVEGGMYRVVVVTYCIRVSLEFLLLTSSFLGCSDLTGGCQASDEECKGERRIVQWIRWGLGNCGLSQPTAFHSYRHWQNHSRNTCVHPPPPSFSVHNFAWRSLKFASTPRVLSIIEKFIPFYAHPMKETRNLCLCICCFADTPFFLDFRSSSPVLSPLPCRCLMSCTSVPSRARTGPQRGRCARGRRRCGQRSCVGRGLPGPDVIHRKSNLRCHRVAVDWWWDVTPASAYGYDVNFM